MKRSSNNIAWSLRLRSPRPSSGIILLVVLGMLTLFSVLAVSYLVFTDRQRVAAASIQFSENSKLDRSGLVQQALLPLLVGAEGPESSLWGHDLLGDLYGMRDAVEANLMPVSSYTGPISECAPAVLLGNQFIRFPSLLPYSTAVPALRPLLNEFPYRRNDNEVARRYPGYTGAVQPLPLKSSPAAVAPAFPNDDELNGRLLTFSDGPLEGLTFPIARYFGDHLGAAFGRAQLTGQVMIDVRANWNESVTVGTETQTLYEWLDDTGFRIDRLFYDYPSTATALPTTATAYGSFYVNGRMLNGPGMGWDRARRQFNPLAGINQIRGVDPIRQVGPTNPKRPFNLNEVVSTDMNITAIENGTATGVAAIPTTGLPFQVPTGPFNPLLTTTWPAFGLQQLPLRNGPDVPVALQGHYALHRLAREDVPGTTLESFVQDLPPGDTDEPYDAPDYNNMFLSYFPTDEILGEKAPSFVRPAMLNWILNNREGGSTDLLRRQRMLVAMQRATMRPLPIINSPTIPTNVADRGRGVKQLSYANFTGSNNSLGLNAPIDFNSVTDAQLLNLARALAGRDDNADGVIDTWDVDNDGDGFPDSVWVDSGMPLTQDVNGRLVKPLVSYLVEDLGGRVNINLAGNMAQARNKITNQLRGPITPNSALRSIPAMTNDAPGPVFRTSVPSAMPIPTTELVHANLPNGWGYGPAEIDVRALFPSLGTSGITITERAPLTSYTASNLIRGPQRLLGERMGMLSSAQGRARPFANMDDAAYGQIVAVPGYLFDPTNSTGDDLMGSIRNPNRPNLHRFQHPQGLPVDAYGRGSVGIGVSGELVVGGTSNVVTNGGNTAGDAEDDPYEMDLLASTEPDSPYTFADMEPLLRMDSLDRNLLSDRLIEIIEDFHNGNGATTQQQLSALRKALADSMTVASNSVATVKGGLPSEFNENSSASTSAVGPQAVFHVSLGASLAAQARNAVMWELMPEELRAGRKMNLNRPFGNGFDDEGFTGATRDDDLVIDDDQNGRNWLRPILPSGSEVARGEVFDDRYYVGAGGNASPFTSSRGKATPGELQDPAVTNHAPASGAPYHPRAVTPRELFARHLYVLAMVLIRDANRDVGFDFPHAYPHLNDFDSPFYGPDRVAGVPTVPSLRLDDEDDDGTGYGYTTTVDEEEIGRQEEFSQEYRAWKIAQWAANVTDFRDSDAVMTRFDYDPNPFDGWDVNVLDNQTYRTVWGMENPELTLDESLAFHDRRVRDTNLDNGDDDGDEDILPSVGAPTPAGAGADLSLQGSDGSATRGDTDLDQWRLPEGSLFLELHSTRSAAADRAPTTTSGAIGSLPLPAITDPEDDPIANASSYPRELYQLQGGEWVLNLGATAPLNDVPVWRIAISEAHTGDGTARSAATRARAFPQTSTPNPFASADFLLQPNSVGNVAELEVLASGLAMNRDTFTGQLDLPDFFAAPSMPSRNSTTPDLLERAERAVDRVIFFANGVNPTAMVNAIDDIYDEGQVFYNRTTYAGGGVFVRGGQHVVVGPRPTTYVGSRENSGGAVSHDPVTDAPAVAYTDFVADQRFELSATQFVASDTSNTRQTPTYDLGTTVNASIRPVVGVVAASDPPSTWTTIARPIGLNVSEPLAYQSGKPVDRQYYKEPTESLVTGSGFPVDSWISFGTLGAASTPTPDLPDRPFDARPEMSELFRVFGAEGQRTGTRKHFKTAYLQRLADPTQPYHAEFNPYRTVDHLTIDLTVFNGSDNNNAALRERPTPPAGPPAPTYHQDHSSNLIWLDPADPAPYGYDGDADGALTTIGGALTAPNDMRNVVPEHFASRYKTGKPIFMDPSAGPTVNLLYSVNTFPPAVTAQTPLIPANIPAIPPAADREYFTIDLNVDTGLAAPDDPVLNVGIHSSTLGYLNYSFGDRWTQGDTPAGTMYETGEAQPNISRFVGLPFTPFATNVHWFNRPFVSAEELMWVPVSSPGRFGLEFGSAVGLTATNQFKSDSNARGTGILMPPNLPPARTPVDSQQYDFNQRFQHLWNYFSSSNNVFAPEPATQDGSTIATVAGVPPNERNSYPWLPNAPQDLAPTGSDPRDDDFVGFPRNSNMTAPYAPIPEKTPSPNFWRLLDWVEVPPPFDFDADFVSPEATPMTPGEDPLFSPQIDFRTLGIIPNEGDPINTLVNGDPRSWVGVVPSVNRGWRKGTGRWENNPPTNNQYNQFWTNDVALEAFRPPHGFKSKLFRNGLINMNTVKNLRVYKALMSGASLPTEMDNTLGNNLPLGRGAFWNEFLRGRRGYTPDLAATSAANNWFEPGPAALRLQTFDHDDNTATPELPSFDRNIPTQFAGVFRSAMGGSIAPLETMRTRLVDPAQNPWEIVTANEREDLVPLQGTNMRREVDRNLPPADRDRPSFQRPEITSGPQDHERSVVHQQLAMTRLSNMATDQSNVFAVWLTVGMFEVDSSTLTVGQEVGIDTGESQRAKGFFIIDRSVPVEYRPGKENNALKTIQLSRILN